MEYEVAENVMSVGYTSKTAIAPLATQDLMHPGCGTGNLLSKKQRIMYTYLCSGFTVYSATMPAYVEACECSTESLQQVACLEFVE